MKKILLFAICFFVFTEAKANFHGSNRDLYFLPISQVEGLLVDCEKIYPEYYPTTPFPERYHTLNTRRKLHFCMRKLVQTGDVYEEEWYRTANGKDDSERMYESKVGPLPDEYYLIPWENHAEKMNFLGKGLDKKYAEDEEKKKRELKKKFGWAANIVGFFNPIVGIAFTGAGAAQ